MTTILETILGRLTNRPYRIYKDGDGIGVTMLCDNGSWDDSGEIFATQYDAFKYITYNDLHADLDRDEIRYNVQ